MIFSHRNRLRSRRLVESAVVQDLLDLARLAMFIIVPVAVPVAGFVSAIELAEAVGYLRPDPPPRPFKGFATSSRPSLPPFRLNGAGQSNPLGGRGLFGSDGTESVSLGSPDPRECPPLPGRELNPRGRMWWTARP